MLGSVGAVLLLGVSGWGQKKPPKPPEPPADPAIAYVAEKGWGHTNLMVMNADGSNQKVLLDGITGDGSGNHDPNWSPDGNWIVFGRTLDSYGYVNYISMIRKDGSGLCDLTPIAQTPVWGLGGAPRWSPYPIQDLSRVLYFELDPGGIFLVNAACPASVVSNLPIPLGQPTWAPYSETKGVRFAAVMENPPGSGDDDIIVFELKYDWQGWTVTETANLTDVVGGLENVDILDMDWARLSDSLAVTAWIAGEDDTDLWVLHMEDPAHPINITNTPTISERAPSWSPLDTQIVFEVRELKNSGIYVMNADGSNVKRLAASASNVKLRAPDWRRNLQ